MWKKQGNAKLKGMHMQNKSQDCHDKSSIQQEEDYFHQQTGLKYKEETS